MRGRAWVDISHHCLAADSASESLALVSDDKLISCGWILAQSWPASSGKTSFPQVTEQPDLIYTLQ